MDYIDRTFGAGGLLATGPGYQERPGQIAMARAVERAITGRKHLLVEGSTGIGKGYAYLVPAIHHAATDGKRVCCATASIILQEQLITKDLPRLAAALPTPFTFALLKGRNNYLCLSRLDDLMKAGPELIDDPADADGLVVGEGAQETIELG